MFSILGSGRQFATFGRRVESRILAEHGQQRHAERQFGVRHDPVFRNQRFIALLIGFGGIVPGGGVRAAQAIGRGGQVLRQETAALV